MNDKLHDHIIFLEEKVQTINARITDPRLTTSERARCEAELRVAETALAHYRSAFEFEEEAG